MNSRPVIVATVAVGIVASVVAIKKMYETKDGRSLMDRAEDASARLQARIDSVMKDCRMETAS